MRRRLSVTQDGEYSNSKKARISEIDSSNVVPEMDAFSDVSLSLWSLTPSVIPAFTSETDLPNDFDSAFSQIINVDPPNWIHDNPEKSYESSIVPVSPNNKTTIGINKPLLDKQDAGVLSNFLEKFLEKDDLWDSKTLDKLLHNQPIEDIFPYDQHETTITSDKQLSTPHSAFSSSSSDSFVPIDPAKSSTFEPRRSLLSIEQKRVNHLTSEKRRRAKCKEYVEELCYLTPRLLHTPTNQKDSNRGKSLGNSSKKKSDMLAAVYSYILTVRDENIKMREKLRQKGIVVDIPVAE